MAEHIYGASEVLAATGLTNVTYQQWKARGLLRTSYESKGPGHPQKFSFDEIMRIAVMAELVRLGISVRHASHHVGGRVWGFTNDEAFLILLPFGEPRKNVPPELEEHLRAELGFDKSAIIPKRFLPERLAEHPSAVVINLDAIEARVKGALGL